MLSTLELCHVFESAFLPLSCDCRVEPSGSLQIQIIEPISKRVELLVTGISLSHLVGDHAIDQLINELKEELKFTHDRRYWPVQAQQKC
ncbi:DUF1652 domain-containing protein [Pseudomonas mandelii]|uniref:DUF1652 domain-containing protein n=1 Tax=Pseudomonas mandelii TaxID=75612 RepID=UPI00224B129B|nr:DUF1652 domain-containing protein [Pseudomonas mandelii]MCX2901541.1 DUF1652 domain-containing protein [Pseudomonas mandelii]